MSRVAPAPAEIAECVATTFTVTARRAAGVTAALGDGNDEALDDAALDDGVPGRVGAVEVWVAPPHAAVDATTAKVAYVLKAREWKKRNGFSLGQRWPRS